MRANTARDSRFTDGSTDSGRNFSAPGLVGVVVAVLATGCWGITAGPEEPDVSFDRDTESCEKNVEECTCYCALRCGDTCVQRLCYDPCSDIRSTDADPVDVRPPETGIRDVPTVPDVESPDTADAGPVDSGLDTDSPDTAPDDSAAPETGPPGPETGTSDGASEDTQPRDTTSPTDSSL